MKSKLKHVFPLSHSQDGLLFRDIYTKNEKCCDEYIVQVITEFSSQLDVELLQKIFCDIADCYDVLKTGFVWERVKKPLQFVVEKADIKICKFTVNNQTDYLGDFLKQDRKKKFDLTSPPLFRINYIQDSCNGKYILVWTCHHILMDGWSSRTILHELFSCYASAINNGKYKVTDRPAFINYVNWLNSVDPSNAFAFWRKALDGINNPSILS